MRIAIVIMAAGKGTRLKSKRPKVLHEIGGRSLLAHVIAAAAQVVPPEDIYVIVGHKSELVKSAVAATGVRFIAQPEQRGTGHAIQCAQPSVAGYENLLVLSGDVPLIRPQTIVSLRDFHLEQRAAMTILTAAPANPLGYGRILRKAADARKAAGAGKAADSVEAEDSAEAEDFVEVAAIIEQKALTAEQAQLPEINSGIYAFASKPLFRQIGALQSDNAQGEYYLTDMAKLLVAAGERVVGLKAERASEVLGANTIAEMMELDAALRLETAQKFMNQGVTIFRPETSVIDTTVTIGPDTVIEPYVQLLGTTVIGEDCRIRSYSVLENSVLADGVLVRHGCILSDSRVEAGALLGPYSHLRPGSEIGEGAHVGNFVETKKIRLGKGSKANHLSYLGDAEIGDGVNIGAGVITCNYDGSRKHMTHIGDGVFVGSDSTLVAPISLGEGAYIAAGSCITENVPAEALALGRSRQTTKPGWVKSKGARAAMPAKSLPPADSNK